MVRAGRGALDAGEPPARRPRPGRGDVPTGGRPDAPMRGRASRHRPADALAAALGSEPSPSPTPRWCDVADDPNAAVALARRAETLRGAWRPAIGDRIRFVEERCSDRRVLDIGCLAHDVARMDSPRWLHGRIAAVAARCVGVDVVPEGVAAMRSRGFDAVVHDLREGVGPLAPHLPFDVIVAGELVEHVEAMDMLVRVAAEVLAPDGQMIVTTPNPYAPHRVRAGQLGIVWENVDHILYAFPSGMAELAERHGLVLTEAATVDEPPRPVGVRARAKAVRRWLAGRSSPIMGVTTVGDRRVRRVSLRLVGRSVRRLRRSRVPFLGETFVYVIRRAA